jgi:hypothetical protein
MLSWLFFPSFPSYFSFWLFLLSGYSDLQCEVLNTCRKILSTHVSLCLSLSGCINWFSLADGFSVNLVGVFSWMAYKIISSFLGIDWLIYMYDDPIFESFARFFSVAWIMVAKGITQHKEICFPTVIVVFNGYY